MTESPSGGSPAAGDPAPDPRPRPQYGEYAPLPPAGAHPATPEFAPPAPEERLDGPAAVKPRPRPAWDVGVTLALILLAVVDVFVQAPAYADFGRQIALAYEQMGIGEFTSYTLADSVGAGLNVLRYTVLAAVIGFSLLRISRRRTAFWIPLVGALVAGIAYAACAIVVMQTDPAFAAYLAEQTASR